MAREVYSVPYGYEPQEDEIKGTLIYYDDFDGVEDKELANALELTESKKFKKLVLYPLHDATINRMLKHSTQPFYKREDRLHDWKRDQSNERLIMVEGWEGKRKKYTPMEAALRHLTEYYPAPHFVFISPLYANLFASYSFFDEWIKKIRLIINDKPRELHPNLMKYENRWEIITGRDENK
ncbi:hypothetical protein [Paenibacillus sp. PDC88]|uniref:hypothetical protein n=1 Tax=Paenibacillus sp. PDC88 TaxID=1884375 RepID=UPI0008958C10|nr:hypothetical protein [Paenibacillus sp. PDC88]SDW69958.1 hypothetical protein SAMN05518848_102729 [Paenibacillus sp. PDC88]